MSAAATGAAGIRARENPDVRRDRLPEGNAYG